MNTIQLRVLHRDNCMAPPQQLQQVVAEINPSEHDGACPPAASSGSLMLPALLVLQLPATSTVADRIAMAAQRQPVYAVIDHFYHAELLWRSLERCGTVREGMANLRILLAVSMSPHQIGVRPGFDVQRLAMAVNQLPGLQVHGVIADLNELIAAHAKDPQPAHSLMQCEPVTALQHSLQLLQQSRFDCNHCAALCSEHRGVSERIMNQLACVTSVIELTDALTQAVPQQSVAQCDNAALSSAGQRDSAALSSAGQRDSAALWSATVISRPSLTTAVVEGGWMSWGRTAAMSASLIIAQDPPDARVMAVSAVTTALQLRGRSLDLRIGDTVQLLLPRM